MQGAIGPDGRLDWDRAIATLLKHKPAAALQLQADRDAALALSQYRAESLKPDVIREYEYAYGGNQPGTQSPTPAEFISGRRGSTAAEKAVDTAFGKEYADWRAGGGYASVRKQIDQLDDAAQRLESGENITGPYLGQIPDRLVPVFNPASKEVRDQVEEAIQSSLRQVLGAAYTEREGVNLLKRTWDPTLEDSVNAKRVRRVLGQLKAMAEAKEDAANYYEQFGSLRGWQGPSLSVDAINPEMPSPDEGNQTTAQRSGPVRANAAPLYTSGQPEARFRTSNNPQGLPPTQENVQALRQMANDPQARQIFDEHFGQGAAEWFLQGGR